MANADPLGDVKSGQRLEISAATWNALLAAAKAFRQPGRPRDDGTPGEGFGVVEVLGLNSTGANLREGKPVRFTAAGGYDLTDDGAAQEWRGQPLLTLGVPTAGGFVGVTREAIPAGKIGRVAVAGVVECDVHVNNSAHTFATPTTNTTALESAEGGTIRIIHKGTGSSTRRCAVYLGDQTTPLNTQNTDGTQADPETTDLRTDKTTGLQTTQAGGVTTLSGIAASTTQMGMVTTGDQAWVGEKRFTGGLIRTAATSGTGTGYYPNSFVGLGSLGARGSTTAQAYMDAGTGGGVDTTRLLLTAGSLNYAAATSQKATANTYGSGYAEFTSGRLVGSNSGRVVVGAFYDQGVQGIGFGANNYDSSAFDIYANLSEWSSAGTNFGPLRVRTDFIMSGVASNWGRRIGSTDYMGVNVSDGMGGYYFAGGLLVGGGGSLPPATPSGPAGGSLTGTFPNPTIAAGAIGTAELANLAVATGKVADDAITFAKMQNMSGASKLMGRGGGAGAGDPEELSIDSTLSMTGTTLSVGVVDAGTW